jgi:spermidine synthase
MSPTETPRDAGLLPTLWLVTTAVVCGGLVMTLEVLGSRVIGPFFGASLFVWTSLIAVTLLSLAVGYAVGGRLADRSGGSADLLFLLVAAAGLATLGVPLLRNPVLRATVGIGIRGGAFVSALVLFAPPLVLLGTVSPFVVRLAVRKVESVGWTVGLFSALSTAGSLAGTVATGFWLIPTFGVSRIFVASGSVALALAGIWFVLVRRRIAALLLLLPPLLLLRDEPLVSKVQENGTRATVLERRDSPYGELKVVEYSFGSTRTRELLIDGLVQGGVDAASGESIYEYSYFVSRLALAKNPKGRSLLTIGLGAGVVPTWFESRGVRSDVVEIDRNVVDLARRYFDFRSSGRLWVEDARACLSHLDGSWDFLFLDVFGGDTTPAHLLSREALASIRPRIAPNGVLVANLITELGPDGWVAASIARTARTKFDVVELHPVFDMTEGRGFGNVILIAYDGPRRPVDPEALANEPIHPMVADLVRSRIGREWRPAREVPSIVLTDDFNPVDFHDRKSRERLRAAILEGTDLDVLL